MEKNKDQGRPCPICSDNMQMFKEVNVDRNRRIQYSYCQKCGLVHSFDHSFFETVLYSDHYFDDIDSGWKERNDEIFSIFDRHFNKKKKQLKILDIGSGKNYFVSLLEQAGYDAYGVDAHSEPIFAKDRFFRDFRSLPYSSYDVIVLLEVIEHFVSPIDEFKRVLKNLSPNGKILFTTVIHHNESKNSTDWYINPRYGHVTIWSLRALSYIFSNCGFKSATINRTGNLQIWDRSPGSFFKQWSIQYYISPIRSAFGRIRYLFKERFYDLF